MIDFEDFNKTWNLIVKNRNCKTDGQTINFFRAVQYGKNLVKDITPEMIEAMAPDAADKIKRINILFDMMKDAQEKAFGGIVDNI